VSITKRQRRDRLAIDERKQRLSFEGWRTVQLGKIAHHLLVVDTGDPQ
jgi:hypothetical protein